MTRIPRLIATAGLCACLAGPAFSAPAFAGQACDGAIQASALQTMPSPLVIAVQNPRDTAKAKLAEASFVEGLQSAGVTVQPNAMDVMHLTFLISVDNGGQIHDYTDFSWTSAPGAAQGPPPTLTITAGVTARGQQTPLWIASLECKVKSEDPTVVAKEIGQVIGEVLSKQLGQKTF